MLVNQKMFLLMPAYLQNFRCLGSACEDHCCYGWDIDVDKRTYKKYQKYKKIKFQQLFREKIKRNKANTSDNKYAKIITNKGICPFLTKANLCLIHSQLGESFLPDVCSTFPRHTKARGKRIEISASVACPEIARLALLDTNGINFVESEIDLKELEKLRFVEQRNIVSSDKTSAEFRSFIIRLLKNRAYELWERLIILGIFINDMSVHENYCKIEEILPIIKSYTNKIDGRFFVDFLGKTPTLPVLQMQILKRLTDEKIKSVFVKAFTECVNEFLAGTNYDNTRHSLEETGEKYDRAYEKYYKPFMKTHEHILENYLVNYLFGSDIPLLRGKTMYDYYVQMVLHYSLIKMYLIGMSAFQEGALNAKMVIKLIYSFTKTKEPDLKFKYYAINLLKENNCTNLMSMAVLIKN